MVTGGTKLGNYEGSITDNFVSFDNRAHEIVKITGTTKKRKASLLRRLGAYSLRGRRYPVFAGGGMHFHYSFRGIRFNYVYIRKNGCSAFKRLFKSAITGNNDNKLNISSIQQTFGVWNDEQIRPSIETIAVVRDPAERLCSLFRNKFIQSAFAEDIQANVENRCGIKIDHLTFSKFVDLYVANLASWQRQGLEVDPHCLAQIEHFWPIKYSRIFLIRNLYHNMKDILGTSLADRFFRERVNNSSEMLDDHNAVDTPVHELREMFHRHSILPGDHALLSNSVISQIRAIYEPDYHFLEHLGFESALHL